MAVIDLRQRTGVLFVAVMLLHVVLISAQVNSKSGVPVLEAVCAETGSAAAIGTPLNQYFSAPVSAPESMIGSGTPLNQ